MSRKRIQPEYDWRTGFVYLVSRSSQVRVVSLPPSPETVRESSVSSTLVLRSDFHRSPNAVEWPPSPKRGTPTERHSR